MRLQRLRKSISIPNSEITRYKHGGGDSFIVYFYIIVLMVYKLIKKRPLLSPINVFWKKTYILKYVYF